MPDLAVAQVCFTAETRGHAPDVVLSGWPTLTGVAEAVARTGVNTTVLLTADADVTLERNRVIYQFVAVPRPLSVGRMQAHHVWLARLFGQVRRLGVPLVHVHGLAFPVETRWLTRALAGARVLVQDHGSRPPSGFRRSIHRWGWSRIRGVAFTSREQASPFFEAGVFRPGLPVFEVIEGSTRFTEGDQSAARRATGIGGDPCLIWVGHLNENKDPLTILRAIGIVAPLLPDLRLWCCFQTAPLMDRVKGAIAANPELQRRVTLLGPQPPNQVELLLRAADFLVSGSRLEGSGYAVIEAVACGTPPLVSDIPPFRRITGSGVIGGLFPPGDAEGLAQLILNWSARDRGNLRREARRHFDRELSFDAIGRQFRVAYETLVAGP